MEGAVGLANWQSGLLAHWQRVFGVAGTVLVTTAGTIATILGDSHRGTAENALLLVSLGAMSLGFLTLLALAIAWVGRRRTDTKEESAAPEPPPDPSFSCKAIPLPDGRVDIALRSSHFPDPLLDLILTKQQLRRGFEAVCCVEMPEGGGVSLTPPRTSCMVRETVTWTYPDDFDARASFYAPPFPLVTGHYTVKCEWRNPKGGRGLGQAMKEAARCDFYIGKTIPASSPEAKRTAVAMEVLGLAIDVLLWYVKFPTEMREADGDTPGERRLRAERDEIIGNELRLLIGRQRRLWSDVEALGIVAPGTYWEPKTLPEVEAWERSLRGLVTALLHHHG